MEIPDVIVINKADHPLTDTMERRCRPCSRWGRRVPGRFRCCAPRPRGRAWPSCSRGSTSTGATSRPRGRSRRRERNLRNEVLGLAAARLRRKLEARAEGRPEVAELLARVTRRKIDPASAARELLSRSDDG